MPLKCNNGKGKETTVTDAGVVVAIDDAGADYVLVTEVAGSGVWTRFGTSAMVAGDVSASADRPMPNDTGNHELPITSGATHIGFRTKAGTSAVVRWIPAWRVV